ncbi:hypothetical protein ABZ814_13435 [Micromonospora musae]|uniref:hypothetical protein n=1 Tax=Micromonospora musae TaxID=1894970 RepID=UPI0033EB72E6
MTGVDQGRDDGRMHPHDPQQPQYVYVQQPESMTRRTAKGMFWIITLSVAVPLLLCIVGCGAAVVLGAVDAGGRP